jgi:hypothetical protein
MFPLKKTQQGLTNLHQLSAVHLMQLLFNCLLEKPDRLKATTLVNQLFPQGIVSIFSSKRELKAF